MEQLLNVFSDERAVSPVIGVILMVAITVILAAVIGTFVLGIGGTQEAKPSASVSSSGSGPYTVTLVSLGDNTDGIYCSGSASTNSTTSVGNSISCGSGESIVAYKGGSPSNPDNSAVVRTLN